jgi:hypothetical protein
MSKHFAITIEIDEAAMSRLLEKHKRIEEEAIDRIITIEIQKILGDRGVITRCSVEKDDS